MKQFYLTNDGPLGKVYFAGIVKFDAKWVSEKENARKLMRAGVEKYQGMYGGEIEDA